MAATADGATTFYLPGIGEEKQDWSYYLYDGTNSARQLSGPTGQVTLTRSFTPWGELLELRGLGDFTWGYLGGLLDAATGLIYVGNGQYYDPATGRFLTRGVYPGSPNPYVPWRGDPLGMMLGPLALVALIRGKRKGGKMDQILMVLIVVLAVNLACVAPGPVPGPTPDPTDPSTPSPIATEPTPDQGSQSPTPGMTPPPTQNPPTSTPCPTHTTTPTPTPTTGVDEPLIQPAGVDNILWDTYVKLRDFQLLTAGRYSQKWETDWWRREDGDEKFTLLEFFDTLLQFELIGARELGKNDDLLKEVAVGNYCFWTTRERGDNDEWLLRKPCENADLLDPAAISRYIMGRGLLNKGKDLTIHDDYNYDYWILWPVQQSGEHEDRSGMNLFHNIDFENAFLNPPKRWLVVCQT